jgi:hypothetical protein
LSAAFGTLLEIPHGILAGTAESAAPANTESSRQR